MDKDVRAEGLANLVLDYSLEIASGDRLIIQFDPAYSEYAYLLGSLARKKGADIRYDSMSFDPKILRDLILRNDRGEWAEELERRKDFSRWCNTRVLIDCQSNSDYAAGIENSVALVSDFNKEVIGPYKKVLYRSGPHTGYEVRWNIVGFPCSESAKAAGMSIDEYSDFVYSATLKNDWNRMHDEMVKIKSLFDDAQDVHILVPGLTDLHLSLSGRGGDICDGKFNMPDGEVCYGPVEDSAEGYIYFQTPTKRDGLGVLQGIRLEYQKGKIVGYSAKTNRKALEETLKVDEGVLRLGELGIGCNYCVKRAILETLFDEKIGGTVHLALGDSLTDSLSEGGGKNSSSIHWDIVCDLRKDYRNPLEFPGGELYVNGNLVQKDGIWKF